MAEGLVVISNGYKNFEKQSKYLSELLAPIKEDWMGTEMEQYVFSCVYWSVFEKWMILSFS